MDAPPPDPSPDPSLAAVRWTAVRAARVDGSHLVTSSRSIFTLSFIDTLTEDIDRRQYVRMAMKQIAVITEACCPQVLRAPLGAEEAEEMAAALRVVADPARLRLISLLAGIDEACVCDLTEPLGLTQPTVSHHLKVLADAGLVDREQRGRWAFFRLLPERVEILRRALSA